MSSVFAVSAAHVSMCWGRAWFGRKDSCWTTAHVSTCGEEQCGAVSQSRINMLVSAAIFNRDIINIDRQVTYQCAGPGGDDTHRYTYQRGSHFTVTHQRAGPGFSPDMHDPQTPTNRSIFHVLGKAAKPAPFQSHPTTVPFCWTGRRGHSKDHVSTCRVVTHSVVRFVDFRARNPFFGDHAFNVLG